MSQVSRPVRIALLAVMILAALWFVALRPKPRTATPSAPAPAPVATTPTAPKQLNAKTPVVGGLLGAVNKANGAVATSQANANQLERNSAAASSSSPSSPAASTPATAASSAPAASASAPKAATKPTAPTTTAHPTVVVTSSNPAITIKNQLAAGKTVALLFWNPASADDQAVHDALKSLAKGHSSLVADFATPGQVTKYGTIVTASQVVETPTLLIMRGSSIEPITGLQDPSDLRQYIGDLDQGGPGETTEPKLTAYAVGTSRATYVTRANTVCRRVTHGKPLSIPLTATPSKVAGLIAGAEGRFVAALNRIPKPAGDRLYLTRLYAAETLADKQMVESFQTTNAYKSRNLLLSSQTNDDFAVQGLKNYGLTACVIPADS